MKLKLDENLGARGRELLSFGRPWPRHSGSGLREEVLDRLLATLVGALESLPFEGSLWVVEEGRVRVFEPPV